MSFNYKIGEEVYSKLHKKNGVVQFRQYVETPNSTFNEYAVMLINEDGSTVSVETSEYWLTSKRFDH